MVLGRYVKATIWDLYQGSLGSPRCLGEISIILLQISQKILVEITWDLHQGL